MNFDSIFATLNEWLDKLFAFIAKIFGFVEDTKDNISGEIEENQ